MAEIIEEVGSETTEVRRKTVRTSYRIQEVSKIYNFLYILFLLLYEELCREYLISVQIFKYAKIVDSETRLYDLSKYARHR